MIGRDGDVSANDGLGARELLSDAFSDSSFVVETLHAGILPTLRGVRQAFGHADCEVVQSVTWGQDVRATHVTINVW